MNKEKTKILTEKGDIYNSCPYIDNLIYNINQIQEYTADSVNQLEYIRDINTKLREEIEDLKNECVELNAYVKDVEGALDTSSKKETVFKKDGVWHSGSLTTLIIDLYIESLQDKIESLQDEITSNLENQIQYLQDEIEELKELNND
jgi:cell division protein FtsB